MPVCLFGEFRNVEGGRHLEFLGAGKTAEEALKIAKDRVGSALKIFITRGKKMPFSAFPFIESDREVFVVSEVNIKGGAKSLEVIARAQTFNDLIRQLSGKLFDEKQTSLIVGEIVRGEALTKI